MPCGKPEWHGVAFPVTAGEIPASIREAAVAMAGREAELWYHHSDDGGEWWLLDASGELLEAFWLK